MGPENLNSTLLTNPILGQRRTKSSLDFDPNRTGPSSRKLTKVYIGGQGVKMVQSSELDSAFDKEMKIEKKSRALFVRTKLSGSVCSSTQISSKI